MPKTPKTYNRYSLLVKISPKNLIVELKINMMNKIITETAC